MACRDSWAANAIRQAYELLTFYPELAQELGKHATIVLSSLRLVEDAPSKINLQYIISKRIHAILTLVLKLLLLFFSIGPTELSVYFSSLSVFCLPLLMRSWQRSQRSMRAGWRGWMVNRSVGHYGNEGLGIVVQLDVV